MGRKEFHFAVMYILIIIVESNSVEISSRTISRNVSNTTKKNVEEGKWEIQKSEDNVK